MTKRKSIDLKNRSRSPQATRAEPEKAKADDWFSPAAIRETVESVVIAFVLAFLFRTFEAEAFVIPTGSMAPTLMGKHKDVKCPMCGYRYQVSASDRQRTNPDNQKTEEAAKIDQATCPMCRFTASLDPNNPQRDSYPSYDGDRILVAKFPYEFENPKRWDVVVFKFPGNATMNYIKRLVGLPGETIKIYRGNLWIHEPDDPDETHFEIARKPPEKILAMLQPVYDNELAPTITGKLHWPARWRREPSPEGMWTADASFELDGTAKPAEIRYQHRVPTPEKWQEIADMAGKWTSGDLSRKEALDVVKKREGDGVKKREGAEKDKDVAPQLISDFTAYNTGGGKQTRPSAESRDGQTLIEHGFGQHWVGDLALQFDLSSKSSSGKVTADLVKGGRHFRCCFDLATGNAELSISGGGAEAEGYRRTAATSVVGAGRHAVIFANVNDELTLWVDGRVVAFHDRPGPDGAANGRPATLDSQEHPNQYDSALLNNEIPTEDDLKPAGISADGAAVEVSRLKVLRDVYYIAVFQEGQGRFTDFKRPFVVDEKDPNKTYPPMSYLSDPKQWGGPNGMFSNGNMKSCTIKLELPDRGCPQKDRFFVLGDNSAQSSDGRAWEGQYWVDRELLIGKALFIYWPHGWEIPYVPLYFNLVPNFERMRLVR